MSLSRFLPMMRWALFGASVALAAAVAAQPPFPAPGASIPRSARAAARTDLTGNWVAQVTEDWRWRMITPPKGDYASVPLSAEGRKVADSWDLARDDAAGEQCRAFGAGGIMRQPTRLRIAWADDDTLRVETDAGQQTRLFHFAKGGVPAGERSWQGESAAEWQAAAPPGGFFGFGGPPPGGPPTGSPAGAGPPGGAGPPPGAAGRAPAAAATDAATGAPRTSAKPPAASTAAPPNAAAPPSPHASLKVVTTNLRPGYLRKNGVPYSEDAVVTEYYDRLTMFGNDYLQVVTVVVDPKYLSVPFVVSNQFKREPDGSKWRPTPCETDPPVGKLQNSPYVP